MKIIIQYNWYYSEDNGKTWLKASEQVKSNSVEWKDHEKVKWVRKINPQTGKPYKQRLRCEHWDLSGNQPIKSYHIEIVDYTESIPTTAT